MSHATAKYLLSLLKHSSLMQMLHMFSTFSSNFDVKPLKNSRFVLVEIATVYESGDMAIKNGPVSSSSLPVNKRLASCPLSYSTFLFCFCLKINKFKNF